MDALLALDHRMFLAVHGAPEATRRFARAVSRSGDGWAYALLALLMTLTPWTTAPVHLRTLAVGFVLELPLCFALKFALRRERPHVVLKGITRAFRAADRFSFPSGHACAAALHAVILGAHAPLAAPLVAAWALAVGWSRVRLGVHFPLDVFSGALVGAVCGAVCGAVALTLS